MSVKVILELHVKPELADRFKEGFKDTLVDTRAFEGCEELSVLVNQDDPAMFVILEQWESRAHYEAYLKWRDDRGDLEGMSRATTEPFKVTFLDYIRT